MVKNKKTLYLTKSNDKVDLEMETPCLVYDLNVVVRQILLFKSMLPEVIPYYALKSSAFSEIIKTVYAADCGFDLASKHEVFQVLNTTKDLSQTIFTNPINSVDTIETCIRYGIRTFVVDNIDELIKYTQYKNDCNLMIRVAFRNPNIQMDLSKKFGCSTRCVHGLLERAYELGLNIKGICFHAGSNLPNSDKIIYAIKKCLNLIKTQSYYNINLIDIGGGFPSLTSTNEESVKAFFDPLREEIINNLDKTFIAEPGRWISAQAGKLFLRVIGKAYKNNQFWYYLNDGVYGTLSGKVFDYATYPISIHKKQTITDKTCYNSVLAGPTCDSFDIIEEDILLPELMIGDIIQFHNIGAYSYVSATTFNGIEKCNIIAKNIQ